MTRSIRQTRRITPQDMANDRAMRALEFRTDLGKYGVVVFDDVPVVGQFVSGRNLTYGRAFCGTYRGIGTSEWTGEPVHMFRDGLIGDTPQTTFTVLVAAVQENPPA